MAGENPPALPEEVTSSNVAHVPSPPTPVAIPPAVQASPDERIAALEGTVNLMAANMAELMSLLRNPNRASSSFAPGHGPTINPTPGIPSTRTPEDAEAPDASLPPPPAPTANTFPPATFLTPDQGISTPQPAPVTVPVPVYTAPPPIVTSTFALAHTAESAPYQAPQPNIGLPHKAPPPLNIAFSKPGTPAHAALIAPPTNFLRWVKKLEEMVKALQPKEARVDSSFVDWGLFPSMHLPLMIKIPEFQRYDGKKLDMGIKLGRVEDPNKKKEGDSSKKNIAGSSSAGNRKGKETFINVVNPRRRESRPFSMDFAPIPPTTQAYAPPPTHYPQQPFSAPPTPTSAPQ
ncbi:hypothetical protein CRG98_014942 [Punica granatum]|uniref:Extensin-like n=1 Tax=Punica granatum TaxID=22663 RepID=A0A2I0K974_PUNGR|nr:hypothetical protein CRG98_014942 [Punica granatum]